MSINPFAAKKIYEQTAINSLLKLHSLSPPKDRDTQLVIDGNLFVSATACVMKKKDGKFLSPVLSETDAQEIHDNLQFFVKGATSMVWALIPIPLSAIAFPLGEYIPEGWNEELILIGPFVFAACLFFASCFINMGRFFLRQKELSDRLWKRGGAIAEIPKSYKKALLRKNLALWKGPVLAYAADEVVNIVPSDNLKLTYDALILGNDIISLIRK
ncbi:MAG: hypothetical protein N4A70_09490 [Pelagimonas sp.]|jgi:hypothetical protein|nr:hypothetical protein [Pelagimonas sp.]